jgi:hypothetical protein
MDYVITDGGSIQSPTEVQAWADAVAGELNGGETSWPAITALMGANVNATQVHTYGYGDTGPSVATGVADTSWLGSGSLRVPFSTAICVTKRTLIAGRSYRGRFYWPALAMSVDSDGHFTPALALASEFASMIAQCGNTGGPDVLEPVVYSAAKNAVTLVTSVAVGDVPDSQRNRRDNLVESYQVAAVPS